MLAKRLLWLIIAAGSLVVVNACHRKTQPIAVRIGLINSMTGPEAPIGENLTHGSEMAMADLKQRGIEVQLVKQDDTGKPDKAIAALEQLTTVDRVAGVVGP